MELKTHSKKGDSTSSLNANEINSKEIGLNNDYKNTLPFEYNWIDSYTKEIQKDLITNLNNYFKTIYNECKNSSILTDNLHKYLKTVNKPKRKFKACLISGIVLLFVSFIGWILYGSLIGTNPVDLNNLASELQNSGVINTQDGWMIFFMVWLAVLCVITAASFICLITSNFIYKKIPKIDNQSNIEDDFLFELFINHFNQNDIYELIESTIPNLKLNYDINSIKQENWDSSILETINLGKNFKLTDMHNFIDGTYNNHYFSIHQTNSEWLNNNQNPSDPIKSNIYTLTFETNNIIDVDFILNGIDNNKLNLSNQIFNELFCLNTNNNEQALNLFSPIIQHKLCQLLTWNPIMKSILQVGKYENKIYVIFRSTNDFLKFNKITNLNYKQLFGGNIEDINQVNNDLEKQQVLSNFDLSTDLMSNYIVENVNLFYSVLSIADCFSIPSIQSPEIIIPEIIIDKE